MRKYISLIFFQLIEQSFVLGLPVLSSVHLQYIGHSFSFDNMFSENSNGTYRIDYDKISDNLDSRNTLALNADISLFYLGLNSNRNHFSLNINEKVTSSFSFDDDVGDLVIHGNAHPDLFERRISFNETTLHQNSYLEFGFGYAREINNKLTIGLKVKYLLGFANLQVKDLNGYAITSYDSIHLVHHGFDAYTTGESYFEDDGDVMDFLKDENAGWAVDLGMNYNINDKLSISAAITDLGQIKWSKGTAQYKFNPADYSFKGFELENVIEKEGESDKTFESELDSLEILFAADEFEDVSYKTKLSANAYVGVNYEFFPGHNLGALTNLYMVEDDTRSAFALYYNYHPSNLFNAVGNLQFRRNYVGIGLGASIKLGIFQFYATTETLTSLLAPSKASFLDARFGINIVFGGVYR
jgi:hypothetical protein